MKELWVFTRQFPSGQGESFLENALPVWREQFGRVRVVPMFRGKGMTPVPDGIDVVDLWADEQFKALSPLATLLHAPLVAKILRRRGAIAPGERAEVFSHARQLARKALIVRERLLPDYDPTRVSILCAWMEDWVNVLGLLKGARPDLRIATMAHGWDLYEHRRPTGRIPFRPSQMEVLDRVFCISAAGRRYLEQRFPQHTGKLDLVHLGTLDHGAAPWSPAPVLRLVSCAYLRHPKRVQDIARALALVKRPVEWTHFGDGPLRPELEALVAELPAHITTELKGSVPNSAIIDRYRQHEVDLFVHLSNDEGLPLSMMEAAGFGVPLVANDVGGVGEIVGPRTGVLLPAGAGAKELAALLDGDLGPLLDKDQRAGVRAVWHDRFNAERNFRLLGEALQRMGR